MTRWLTALVLIVLMPPIAAGAQQPVGSLADLWSRVRSGRMIYVTDASARETRGTLVNVNDGAVTVLVDGKTVEIPSATVRQIERGGDSLRNGFLIGTAVGAASAAGALSSCNVECRGSDSTLAEAGFVGVIALEFGGIGALVDYLVPGRTVVYRAPTGAAFHVAPIFLAHNRGVRIAIAF